MFVYPEDIFVDDLSLLKCIYNRITVIQAVQI